MRQLLWSLYWPCLSTLKLYFLFGSKAPINMMTLLLSLTLVTTMSLPFMSTPYALGSAFMVVLVFLSAYMMSVGPLWFPITMFLIYVGALMVLFLYMTCLSPNMRLERPLTTIAVKTAPKIGFLRSPSNIHFFMQRPYTSTPRQHWEDQIVICKDCELLDMTEGPCGWCTFDAYPIGPHRLVVYKCQVLTCPRANWWIHLRQCAECREIDFLRSLGKKF